MDGRDPSKKYAIPQDNPFVDDPSAVPEIYAMDSPSRGGVLSILEIRRLEPEQD